jgi:hypothetical protein
MESNKPWLEALLAGFDMFLTSKFLSVFSPLWFLGMAVEISALGFETAFSAVVAIGIGPDSNRMTRN